MREYTTVHACAYVHKEQFYVTEADHSVDHIKQAGNQHVRV